MRNVIPGSIHVPPARKAKKMSHDLVQSADGTQTSFGNFGAHKPAWHTLGTELPEQVDGKRALEVGGLDYIVEKIEQTVTVLGDDDFETLTSPDVALVRRNIYTGKHEIVGTVSPSYEIVQNHEWVPFMDAIVAESGANYTTAGELNSGSRIFISLKLPQGIKVGGIDPVDMYLVVGSSHDGNSAAKAHLTTMRPVCGNTYNYGLKNSKSVFSMAHTRNVRDRMKLARTALGMSVDYLAEFETIANGMIETPMTVGEFEQVIDQIWVPKDHSKDKTTRGSTIASERRAMVRLLFTQAQTQEIGRGTRWAAFNAVTEFADHYASSGEDAEVRNATRAMSGGLKNDKGVDVKARAMALLS